MIRYTRICDSSTAMPRDTGDAMEVILRISSTLITRAAVATLASTVGLLSSAEAAYPERPITVIVAYTAGGATDVTARLPAPHMEARLGEGARIVVLNRGGAGGEIGFTALARAPPDGYTIGFINTPNYVMIPIERKARYSPSEIEPIADIVDDPGVMTVRADSGLKTAADLVAKAKERDSSVTVGSTGVGSDDHLAMLMPRRAAGVRLIHVPFPGSPENSRAMLGGHILVTGENLGEAPRGQAGGDKTTVLGVMSEKRWAMAPDLPTYREQGFDIIPASLRGIGVPKGVPAEIREKLTKVILDAAADPDFKAKAGATFQPLRVLGPADFAAELNKIDAQFRILWAENPWRRPSLPRREGKTAPPPDTGGGAAFVLGEFDQAARVTRSMKARTSSLRWAKLRVRVSDAVWTAPAERPVISAADCTTPISRITAEVSPAARCDRSLISRVAASCSSIAAATVPRDSST